MVKIETLDKQGSYKIAYNIVDKLVLQVIDNLIVKRKTRKHRTVEAQ